MKIIISANTAWNLLNFRSELISAMILEGHQVVAVAPYDKYVGELESLGCKFVSIDMDNGGKNALKDALLIWRYWQLLTREQPDIFLGFTIKPNIYGTLVANYLRIPVINNIAGLGAVFIKGGWVASLVQRLYRIALARSFKVFFQNPDDMNLFLEADLVKANVVELLPGSGIDLNQFTVTPMPASNKPFRFLLIARMLRDKGVVEFAQAAKLLRKDWPLVEFCLLGFVDVKNPAAISRSEINELVEQGIVSYLGHTENVCDEISNAHCVVLPSYREGTPRSLLEAAAMARPIVTTDAAGCRQVVDHNVNGYLCKVRDYVDLAKKMNQILLLSSDNFKEMGLRGREKMENEFSIQIVIDKYLKNLRTIVLPS